MSSSSLDVRAWLKAPAALAIVVMTLGAVLAAYWCLIAGLWTLATAEYGALAIIIVVTALLIGAPVLGYKLASKDRTVLSLTATVPALLIYCAAIISVLSQYVRFPPVAHVTDQRT